MSENKLHTDFFLQFIKEGIIPLSLLPEIALFLTDRKEFLRLTVEEGRFHEVANKLNERDISFASRKIYSIYKGNTWYDIKFENQINELEMADIHDVRYLINCTLGKNDPNFVLDAEESGRIDQAGILLGYPECCINAIDELNRSGLNWPLLLLERTKGNANGYANRLASVWGGTSFTGELFPCSLDCEHAISLGKKAEIALWELGLNRLSREIQYMSQRSVMVNKLTGEVQLLDENNCSRVNNKETVAVFFK